MAVQFTPVRDSVWVQATGIATAGTTTQTITTSAAPFTDCMVRLKFTAYLSVPSASHLSSSACVLAECVVNNKNNVVTFATAIATSANPMNSNTAGGELTSRPQTSDAGTSTLVLTISGNNVVATFTNNSGSTGNVTIVCDFEYVGSTS